jgi:hypothetical protein
MNSSKRLCRLATSMSLLVVTVACGDGRSTDPTSPDRASELRAEAAKVWQTQMLAKPLPGIGCFNAQYPISAWQEVRCVTVPPEPHIPASGTGLSKVVGAGNDFLATTTTSMSWAEGSFSQVTPTNESDSDRGRESFNIQLNSNTFTNAFTQGFCQGGTTPAVCRGWQQFLFQGSANYNNTTGIYIQYWLLNYGADAQHPCPTGWTHFTGDSRSLEGCYRNSTGLALDYVSAHDAMARRVGGYFDTPSPQVYHDVVYIANPDGSTSAAIVGSLFHLGEGNWRSAEFNIFGYCCGSQANFSDNTSARVQLNTYQGLPHTNAVGMAANCAQSGTGFTAETNNLRLIGSCGPNNNNNTGIAFNEGNQAVCGDGICQSPETCGSCPQDCGGCACSSTAECAYAWICGAGGICTTTGCDATHPCNGGCCTNGTCAGGGTPNACGSSGGACATCGGTTPDCLGSCTCKGCIQNGVCVSSSNSSCGSDGAACVQCSAGVLCNRGSCSCDLSVCPDGCTVNGECKCGPNTCPDGCCYQNSCHMDDNRHCGTGGSACIRSCPAARTCIDGQCLAN